MDVNINAEKFFQRLEKFQTDWTEHKSTRWGGSDAICIPFGATSSDAVSYSKSSAMHLYLLGYEFPDSIIVITKNSFYFMSTKKKCAYLESALVGTSSPISVNLIEKDKDDGVNKERFHNLLSVIRKGGGKRLGSLFSVEYVGKFIPQWLDLVRQGEIEMFEIAPVLGMFFATKDEGEIDLSKRASVLTNKVMKHGFVTG
jgi:nucleosome binding factor SPN SPT16 subunit